MYLNYLQEGKMLQVFNYIEDALKMQLDRSRNTFCDNICVV